MVYIKKMVMHGFKSFAHRTEIIFDPESNVILGANGSGKSNISDALCFVLGRLSIKSIRAAKAKNLLFMGSKYIKPAKEAVVDLVFDNKDRIIPMENDEIHITRIVRRNGQSIYKINQEVKTRTEVIEMLAQVGIDPHGFNIILQGQIHSIVRMQSEERRKIIEEVAGISIYESRKEKSLHELEKTEEKLREISAILRERTGYLKNLDKEREQALKFKELETITKRAKATILQKKIEGKQKEIEAILKSIKEKSHYKEKIRGNIEKIQKEIENLSSNINQINKNIQQATGIEQETIHNHVANLKAELEGLRVRRENYENRKEEIKLRIEEIKKTIPSLENEIADLKKESPILAQKSNELKKKKSELGALEDERSKILSFKGDFQTLKEIIKEKERQLSKAIVGSESLLKQMEELSSKLIYKNEEECLKDISLQKSLIHNKEKLLQEFKEHSVKDEKFLSVAEAEIERIKKIKNQVKDLEICPLCQNKITVNHISHVIKESEARISEVVATIDSLNENLSSLHSSIENTEKELKEIKKSLSSAEIEVVNHRSNKEKNEQLKIVLEQEKSLKNELNSLEEKRKFLENKVSLLPSIQEKYDLKILEIEEISSRTSHDINTTLLYKERDVENTKNIIKRSSMDLENIQKEILELTEKIKDKLSILGENEEKEQELNKRFKNMFEKRDIFQKRLQEKNIIFSETQSEIKQVDEQINYLKIGKARLDAEHDALKMEISDYAGIEILSGNMQVIEERLKKAQEALSRIGSINMRALEVYEEVKKEYIIVQDKVDILNKEKQEILNIINEIDKKKNSSFMKTFKAINDLFSQNFTRLSSKGFAFLEIENKDNIFEGGINIIIKMGKGKYLDVKSLSGGEQTIVALSLLFAIQEYKPYNFYIFDEIDAALDKRNSERLASLVNKYMKSGQYIIITHNDAIILNSNILYGVSMHEGVSKILSLKVGEEFKKDMQNKQHQEEIKHA